MPTPSPTTPPAVDAADRAADAMVDTGAKTREAAAAMVPPPPPGGYTTAKVVALCEAFNDLIEALGADQYRCAWVAPKGMPKWAQSLPTDLVVGPVGVLRALTGLLPPKDAAALALNVDLFADDKGIAEIAALLAKVAKDKKLLKAVAEAAESAAGHAEPDGDEGRAPTAASDNDGDEFDPSTAGAMPMPRENLPV